MCKSGGEKKVVYGAYLYVFTNYLASKYDIIRLMLSLFGVVCKLKLIASWLKQMPYTLYIIGNLEMPQIGVHT